MADNTGVAWEGFHVSLEPDRLFRCILLHAGGSSFSDSEGGQKTTRGGKCLLRRTDRKLKPGGGSAVGTSMVGRVLKTTKRPVLRG